jgi:3-oxoacyl-[acyl-carrier protein] reductase
VSSRFAGRAALVTGAASGIGAEIVRGLVAEGARVLALDVQAAALDALSRESGCDMACCDVTGETAVRGAVAHAERAFGRLDIVVNAAGIVRNDDVADIDDAVWSRLLDVNLSGAMRVCRAALPGMRRRRAGAIVNIASVAAFNASPGMASYAASKAGLVALTRALAQRYGVDGIRANCLCPGWVRTPMSEQEMRDAAQARGTQVEAEFAQLASRIALGRIARPDEMARCALFLASDDASFVTGAVLVADGGARTPASARAN